MSAARQRLQDYLDALARRMRVAVFARAGATAVAGVLIVLCVAVVWLTPLGFPAWGVLVTRLLLTAVLLVTAMGLVWWPLRQFQNRGAVLEQALPQQEGRVQTFIELHERPTDSPLMELLAEDALHRAQQSPIDKVIPGRRLWVGASITAVGLLTMLYLLTFGAQQWGYGSRHILLGATLPAEAVPVRQVLLQPGNQTVRRNADLQVQARVRGFKPEAVQLFVRFADSAELERAAMQPVPGEEDGRFALTLFALRAPLSYFAVADGIKSEEYKVTVVDAPRIDSVAVQLTYPQWTGLPPAVAKELSDLQVVADTQVRIAVRTAEPLVGAVIQMDDGAVAMNDEQPAAGEFVVTKPGRYRIAARVAGDLVPLTDEYEIALVEDQPPVVEVVRPGRDTRATSVEEVPLKIRAQDDFRVQRLEMRYAVNGGEWQRIALPADAKEVDAKTLLQMEELGGTTPLVPGDLVAYYAVANDRHHSVQTDLFMVQVQPFERRFSEAPGGGGGGNGETSEQQQIAERQREILVATWNLQRARDQQRRTPQQIKESAELLSDLQGKLSEQTTTLIERTRARTRGNPDPRIQNFLKSLDSAVKAMGPAVTQLSAIELPQAVPNEQQALQMLLRAEASFRDIQVAQQQDGQPGGNARASRDISELYELEMDLTRNKYETEKELSQEQSAANQELDAALNKLKELAERQEKLAEQQAQRQQPNNADRWRQEQLRREAEELRRRLQELARQSQQGQSERSQGQPSGGASSQSGSSAQRELTAALNSLDNALQAMRNAEQARNDSTNPRQSERAAQAATRRLRQAVQNIEQSSVAPAAGQAIERLAEQAKRAADAQRSAEQELYRVVSGAQSNEERSRMRRDGLSQEQADELAVAKQGVLDQVTELENKLRDTAQAQRSVTPKAAQRLGEIVDELGSMNPQSRLSRSIIDVQRGRADQALMNEGLITEALQNTASDLRNAARMAAKEAQQRANTVEPEALLTELAQLRRALQGASRAEGGQEQAGPQAITAQSINEPGSIAADAGANANRQLGADEAARLNADIRRQLEGVQARVNGGNLTQADLQALRSVVPQVRRLGGDPLADRAQAVASLERLELLALAAAEKSRKQAAARAGATQPAAQEGETVAEYYRRLAR